MLKEAGEISTQTSSKNSTYSQKSSDVPDIKDHESDAEMDDSE
jgi:hypothetical protein